jgi:putative O-methyltransferase
VNSAADIPYQLRPNKFIDRQIFVDLLSRVIPGKRDGTYVYVSMGGKHLVDQESVYRRTGVRNLFSFDGSASVVDRMACNRPLDRAVCVEMHSGSLAGEIDSILARFWGTENIIVWFDYTKANERFSQLQEFAELLKRGRAGDVFRITMNADHRNVGVGNWQKEGFKSPGHSRAWRLRDQIGAYLPNGLESVPEEGMANALASAVAVAVSEAEAETDLLFSPVLLTSYADKQRMFTATVFAHTERTGLPEGLLGWEFLSSSWSDVIDIAAPDLSLREKTLIDRHLTKDPGDIIDAIGFLPATEHDDAIAALQSYKRLHRFYPTFYAIGIQ